MAFVKPSPMRTLTIAPQQQRSVTVGIFRKKTPAAVEKAEPKKVAKKTERKESIAAPTMNALNFSTYVSKKDQQLLDEAKYGELEGGKMSREQYGALRRKVGGTAKDFFKDFVEEEQVKLPAYYKPSEGPQVPFLPILVGILIAVLGTTALLFAK